MKILALESTAKAASAALWEDGRCVGLYLQNCGLTHSETLLPMAENLLRSCRTELKEVDLIAVARGPGSFTGVRIGVAAAKGLMWGLMKPCCGVSTLEAMAWQAGAYEGKLLCCCMDARRSQVYCGLFRMEGGVPRRVAEDRAMAIAELLPEISEEAVLLGDGAHLMAKAMEEAQLPYLLAPEPMGIQSAWGVALAAAHTDPADWGEPDPVYLRLSQAERERLERMNAT